MSVARAVFRQHFVGMPARLLVAFVVLLCGTGCSTVTSASKVVERIEAQADAVLAPPTLEDWLRPQTQSDPCVLCLQSCLVCCAEVAVANVSAPSRESQWASDTTAETSEMPY